MLSFAALADPTRRRIVELLAERERTAGEIVGEFDFTAPAISQHLKILREASLVRVRAEGQRRIHSLDPQGLEEIGVWIAKTRRFWESRFDALEEVLRGQDAPPENSAQAPAPAKPAPADPTPSSEMPTFLL